MFLTGAVRETVQQIALAFLIQIDKDVVRRILAHHYRPPQNSGGPSWLTFLGQMKDSLWSIDLFRCASAMLRSHWILGGHGSAYAPNHWLRSPCGNGRRCLALSDVQPRHSRATLDAKLPLAPPTIRSFAATNGKAICGYWK